jgi:cell division protein FtsB
MLRVVAGTGLALVALGVLAMIGVQFARIVEHNLVLARELRTVHTDVQALERKRAEQQRTIRRLHDPEGAVPEIHDRLHLVRPGEVIIYVKSANERGPAP